MTPDEPGFGPPQDPPPAAPPPPSMPPSMSPPPGPPAAEKPLIPWADRARLGFVPALIETIKLMATDPKEAYSRIRADGDYMNPFIFGLIVAWVMSIVSQLWSVAFSSVFSLGDASALGAAAGVGIVQVIVIAVIYPLIHLVVIFIWSGLHHLSLMALSALDQSNSGFEGTFKVLSYAMVAQLASIVPFVGPFISLALMIFFLVVGFQQVHHTSQGKAIGAALMPILICCICGIIIAIIFGGAIAAAVAGAGGASAFQ